MAKPGQSSEQLAKLERARQLYLFGEPSREIEPIKNSDRLVEETGLSKTVIVKHIGIWSTELVAMAQSCHRNFSHAADPTILEANEDDIVFIRETLDALKREIRAITDVKDSSRMHLMSQYHTLSERWRKLTGVSAAMEISSEAIKLASEAAIKGTLTPGRLGGAGKRPTSPVFDMDVDPNEEPNPQPPK